MATVKSQETQNSYLLIFKEKVLSNVPLFETLWTAACQAPLSIGFSRQEYWSGSPFPSPRESSPPRDKTWVSGVAGRFLNQLSDQTTTNKNKSPERSKIFYLIVWWEREIYWQTFKTKFNHILYSACWRSCLQRDFPWWRSTQGPWGSLWPGTIQGLLPGLMDTKLASQDVHERTRQSGLPPKEASTPRTARSMHTHAEQADRKQNNSELPQTESSPQMLFCEETANEINGVQECT